jgi:hypothetical protein
MVCYYFLPRIAKERVARGDELDRELLAAHGLAEVLADVRRVPEHGSVSFVHDSVGPGQQPGTVITPVSKHRGQGPIGNLPGQQTWQPIGDGKKAWVGALTKDPPSPLDLERWKLVGGLDVIDPGSHAWTVPVARAAGMGLEFGTLPQSYTFNADGEPIPNLLPQYAWLWELGAQIRDWYASQTPPEGDDVTPEERAAFRPRPVAWLIKAAAKVLGVNYRVGLAELNLLHELGRPVLTQETAHTICQQVVNYELVEEAKKKPLESDSPPAPSSSPSNPGAVTPPASPGIAPLGAPC